MILRASRCAKNFSGGGLGSDWVDVHAEDLPECGRVGAPHLRVAALLEAVAQILAPRLRVLARDVLDLYVLVDARDRAHSLDVIVGRAHVSVDDECVQVGAEASAQTIQELVGSSVDKVRLRPFPLEVVCDDEVNKAYATAVSGASMLLRPPAVSARLSLYHFTKKGLLHSMQKGFAQADKAM
eukprot:CAMPEP_0115579404 /NCGR_PEP_ID=MMETSP0272-20121206/4090_1 /TAXON_ID=71861 /ORGANISM="Scrippsiella trochoidea, Strain CCMP3099" /LENGTH=182 /DNA_ID=CAMNT_0003014285 /DNA_START=187 /DNA_END=735 /DNA_ORIENTATION=+